MKLRILGNALTNLAGGMVPALVTLLTIPLTVRYLGDGDYGTLALITAIVGYFALIDINVTSGAVKHIASYHAQGDTRAVNQVVTLGLAAYAVIGVAGALVGVFGASWLATAVFEIAPERQADAAVALRIGGVGFLFAQLQLYLQSVPQALSQFRVSARYEALFGSLVPMLTAIVAVAGGGLVGVVVLRTVASAINVAVLWKAVRRLLPAFRPERPGPETTRSVLSFSGYAYLARIAAVSYAQADKLIIGALVGVQALTYYVVPFTLVGRVFAMSYRLGAVMFPAASALAARGEIGQLRELYLGAVRYTVFLNGVICVGLATLAGYVLELWMGGAFAERGAVVLSILAAAFFLDSLTNLPSLVNDGLGHPAISGLFAIVRALIGAAGAWWLVGAYGLVGAAYSQMAVSALMALLFIVFVHGRSVPIPLAEFVAHGLARSLLVLALAGAAGWGAGRCCSDAATGAIASALAIAGVVTVGGYALVLRDEDRARLLAWARKGAAR